MCNPSEKRDQNVAIKAPLMSLINDNYGILPEHKVGFNLFEQYTISHELDGSLFLRKMLGVKPNLVPDEVTHFCFQLISNPLSQ